MEMSMRVINIYLEKQTTHLLMAIHLPDIRSIFGVNLYDAISLIIAAHWRILRQSKMNAIEHSRR